MRLGLMASSLAIMFSGLSTAEEVQVKFLSEGVTQRVGGYSPARAEMDQEASIVKKLPEDFTSPKYGVFKFADKQWAFVVDQPEEGEQRMRVDSNQDGDLTNDPEPTWKLSDRGMYQGEAEIVLGNEQAGKINMYRFDASDKRREQLKNTVLYYSDFGFEFAFKLDNQEFTTFVSGALSGNASLPVDRDKNGAISRRYEVAKIGEAFNFTGSTYHFSVNEGKLHLELSDEKIAQAPLPPDLRIGKQALKFTAKTMDGAEIEFPKAFAGKIVMLDCWATWCGPCIAEIPNMKQAYEDWHDKGFEILGVSFDMEGKEDDVRKFLSDKELPWPQIFEGKGWDTSIGVQHDVNGIPFVLLIDGDSGEILGTARQLRGEKLTEFIGEQLEKKSASK